MSWKSGTSLEKVCLEMFSFKDQKLEFLANKPFFLLLSTFDQDEKWHQLPLFNQSQQNSFYDIHSECESRKFAKCAPTSSKLISLFLFDMSQESNER